jgi:DNA-binding ferritin-like protein (Dps family)
MSFWETATGGDLTREWKAFDSRVRALPVDYQATWAEIKTHLSPYGDVTGRKLTSILDSTLGLLEETASDGQSVHEALGDDIRGSARRLPARKGPGNIVTGGASN